MRSVLSQAGTGTRRPDFQRRQLVARRSVPKIDAVLRRRHESSSVAVQTDQCFILRNRNRAYGFCEIQIPNPCAIALCCTRDSVTPIVVKPDIVCLPFDGIRNVQAALKVFDSTL